MGIFNQQPNSNQSYTKGKRGITGPQGPPGPPGPKGASGTGFNLTSDRNYDMQNKKLVNVAEGTNSNDVVNKKQMDDELAKKVNKSGDTMSGVLNMGSNKITGLANPTLSSDAISKSYLESKTPLGVRDRYSNFDCQQKVLFNNAINGNDVDVINVKWVKDRYLPFSGGAMSGNLDMNHKMLYHIKTPVNADHAVNKGYVDNGLRNKLDKAGGSLTADLNLSNNKITHLANPTDSTDGVNKNYVDANIATKANLSHVQNVMRQVTYKSDKAELNNYMKLDGTNSMTGNMNLGNNKITNLTNPTDSTDGVNVRTLNNHIIKPSDHTNRFAHLMDPTNGLLQWTDLLTNSVALNSIGDLNSTSGNYHTYNKKVIYASIRKNSQGGYKWRLAIQCYPLQKDKEYTLCLEILTTDYQLWYKSVITVDTNTSQGVTVKRWHVNKHSHEYRTSSNQVEYMYYHKLLVTFSKTTSSFLTYPGCYGSVRH